MSFVLFPFYRVFCCYFFPPPSTLSQSPCDVTRRSVRCHCFSTLTSTPSYNRREVTGSFVLCYLFFVFVLCTLYFFLCPLSFHPQPHRLTIIATCLVGSSFFIFLPPVSQDVLQSLQNGQILFTLSLSPPDSHVILQSSRRDRWFFSLPIQCCKRTLSNMWRDTSRKQNSDNIKVSK